MMPTLTNDLCPTQRPSPCKFHVSPACAEDLGEMPTASANDAEDAMETRLPGPLAQVMRPLGGWRCSHQVRALSILPQEYGAGED
jgi:hypothetical protein